VVGDDKCNRASLEGGQDGTRHVDVVMLGDSWVDGVWCGSQTWPMLLARKRTWAFLNVGKCGTVVNDCYAQMEVALAQLQELGATTDVSTIWVIHSGGNDVLFGLLPYFVQMTADVIRMHIILSTGGTASLHTWLLTAGEQRSAWLTYVPHRGKQVAMHTSELLHTLKARCGAQIFVVSSNTISSAMPMCRMLAAVVTPVCGLRILDMIALIVGSRLTASLAQFERTSGPGVKVHFFDEQAVCVERRSVMKWRHDSFHPMESDGHDILAESCDALLRQPEPITALAARKEAELKVFCSARTSKVWGMLEVVTAVTATAAIGIPLCSLVTVVNICIMLFSLQHHGREH